MNRVFLSLGSNIEDRRQYLLKAISELKERYIKIEKISSFYETEPVGFKDQPFFMNIVLQAETKYEPFEFLVICKLIEKQTGRIDRERWHEREIDIDIIFFNDLILNSDILVIPHPEFHNRKFVLEPLNEIASDFICPKIKKSVSEILSECKDKSMTKKIL
jgi:2-amino-4-hydroxy-6-hydroxymethyldihydropteridine diphosphokinase